MIIDKTSGPGNGNIYSTWSQFSSSCAPGSFTRSTTAGTSFENCTEVLNQPQLGTMIVGNSGEVYICGQDIVNNAGIAIAKSTNAQVPGSLITWNPVVVVFMDGIIQSGGINPVGLIGQGNIDVDRSNGVGQDNIYLLATMMRTSNFDPGDVMFAKSSDGALTWSSPVKLNDDTLTTNTQWLGTLSVARMEELMLSGLIHVIIRGPTHQLFIIHIPMIRVRHGRLMKNYLTHLIHMLVIQIRIRWAIISI